MQKSIYLDYRNKLTTYDLASILLKKFQNKFPIIVCLGSNYVLSDMVAVFVADFLKARKLPFIVFGGTQHDVNKNIAKLLYKKTDSIS